MRRPALAAAVTVGVVVAALLTATSSSAASSSAATNLVPATTSVVRLPTGDAVQLRSTAARQQVRVVAADPGGVTGQFERLAAGGHQYVFPAEVRPLLGVLDPSLFDVTALASAGSAGRTPVTLTFRSGARINVPGLTVTSRTATTARGYLTASSGFRNALVSAWRVAARPGASPPAALFGGVTRLSAANATPRTVQPHYPQVTLLIDVSDETGQPASGGLVGLINTDNSAKFINFVFYSRGHARVSLPTGHYSAITDVGTFDPTNGFTDRIIPIADFTVSANMQHLRVDAADATAVPSVTTPLPADVLTKSVEFDRTARNGGSLGSSFLYDGSSDVRVAPTRQARVGSMYWLTGWSLVHDSATAPYSYDLSFVDNGSVPADQSRTVQTFQLATIESRYYNDSRHASQFVRTPIYPFQFGAFSLFLPLPTPTTRTEYVYGDPSAIWTASLLADPTFTNPFGGAVDDDFRVYPQGSNLTAAWLRGPLAPKPPEQTSGDTFYSCPACRTERRMSVLLAPFSDTTPGHFGEVSDPKNGPATQFALYRGKTVLASGPDFIGARVSVPPGSARYRLHLAVDRSADHTQTSTATVTDLVFNSSATDGAPLPSGWACGVGTSAAGCRVLPLLTAQVPLPTNIYDRVPVGESSFVLTIAPFHGAGTATITSARVLTKVGTGPFQPADIAQLSNGHYRVTLHSPAETAGQAVTLRVSAADDAGDSITQTTTAAYLVAQS